MIVEPCVVVLDEVVALVNGLPDCFVHTWRLEPWLTVRVVDMVVGSEEREVGAKLVELNG